MITVRTRHLLTACLRGDDTAVAAFTAWKHELGSGDLDGSELRLMPMLHANLRRHGVEDPMLARLGGMAKHVWLSGEMRLRDAMAAVAELARAGVPVTAFKGMALLARWPEVARTRPMGDFDVLIHPDHARKALAALEAAGWLPLAPSALFASGDMRRFHALGLLYCENSRTATCLDLHWRPAALIEDPAYAVGLAARAEPARIGNSPLPVASLADHLFVLLAHALLELRMPRRDWVAEAAVTLRLGKELDWDVFGRMVRRYRMQAWSRAALALIGEVAGNPVPSAAMGRSAVVAPWQRREIATRGGSVPGGLGKAWGDTVRSGRPLRSLPARLALDAGWERRLPKALQLRCLMAGAAGLLDLADGIDLAEHPLDGSTLAGWWFPEAAGRWTVGPVAWLAFTMSGRVPDRIPMRLRLTPFIPTLPSGLRLHVWAGAGTQTWCLGAAEDQEITLDARPHRWGRRHVVPVQLRIERAHPLAEAATDPRDLGVFLRRVDVALPLGLPGLARPLRLEAPGADRAAWSGWGGVEPYGRWTVGPEARLLLRRDHPGPGTLRLDIPAVFGPPGHAEQTVDILVDGRHAVTAALSRASGPHEIEMPVAAAAGSGGLLDLRLRPRHPAAPAAAGHGDDPRMLGIVVRQVAWQDRAG